MKIIKQIITIVAIAIFMLGSFNVNAQEKQNKKETTIVGITIPKNSTDIIVSDTNKKKYKIPANQYGKMHNQILENFYNSGKKVSDYSSNADLIDAVVEIALELYPDFKKHPNFYDGINTIKLSFKYNPINKKNVFNDLRDNLWRMRDAKKNVDLYNITSNFIKFKQFSLVKKTYPNLNSFEQELIERFTSVLNHSKSYWNSKNQYNKKDDNGNGVIFADAVGALIFWPTGPGSIVAGAALSMIINSNT